MPDTLGWLQSFAPQTSICQIFLTQDNLCVCACVYVFYPCFPKIGKWETETVLAPCDRVFNNSANMKWNEHQSSVSATHRHLPWEPAIYLYKDSILCCCSCWPSTPAERSSGWRKEALCAGGEGETGRSGLQIVKYFQEPILYTQFLYLLICRKALKSFMETIVSCD